MRSLLYAAITLVSFIGADTALDQISVDTAFNLSLPTGSADLEGRKLIGAPLPCGFEPHNITLLQGSPGPNSDWKNQTPEDSPIKEGDTVYRCLDGSCCTELEYKKADNDIEISVDIPIEVIKQCLKR